MQVSKSLYRKNNKNVFTKNKTIIVRTYSFFQTCISIEECYFSQSWCKCSDESKGLYVIAKIIVNEETRMTTGNAETFKR